MASLFFLLFLLYEAASEPVVILGRLGQDVTLPCQTRDINIEAVEWTRSDLVAPEYVLLHSDGHSDPTFQHSSFKDRVQLVDGELKTGNVSLILKNVSRDDVGTYECRVDPAGSGRKKGATINTEPISIVRLQVTDSETVVIEEQLGQDVTLQCQTRDINITAVEWTRSDPKPPKDILFWRDGHIDSPFKDRVQLVDGELKTGDASLILKDVSKDDVGTYECRVKTAGSGRKKRALIDSGPIGIVRLQVTDPGDQNGHSTHLHVGLVAAVLLVCSAAVGLFLGRKSKRQRDKTPELSPAEETGGDDLI